MKSVYRGALLIAKIYLVFEGMQSSKHRVIDLSEIKYILLRRHLHNDSSIGFFTALRRSFFITFVDDVQRRQFLCEEESREFSWQSPSSCDSSWQSPSSSKPKMDASQTAGTMRG
jgi:hypothetical protein